MPRLACLSCGREIYTVVPIASLFAEERRCPRCGAFLDSDRRLTERRERARRLNPAHDPGPPDDDGERRLDERRKERRRRAAAGSLAGRSDAGTWAG